MNCLLYTSTSGEIILNVADDMTYILDAMTGFPVALEDVKDGDTIYAYIGPAMTMSLPPMTNAVMIFTNLPADAKAPDYVEVKSMVTDAGTSKSVSYTHLDNGADGSIIIWIQGVQDGLWNLVIGAQGI